MSQTEIPQALRGKELGRVVRLLRRELTDVELRQVLERRYTNKTWRAAATDFNLIPRVTRWDCKRIDDAVLAFAEKMGRWPVDRDWGPTNFLPSGKVWRYHNESNHWCRGEWHTHYRSGIRRINRVPHPTFWQRIVARCEKGEVPIELILRIPNQVVRRDAVMAIGGPVKLAEAGHGTLMHEDEYGKLWRLNYVEPGIRDWASWYVEVVNSTPRMVENGYGDYVLDPGPDGEPVYDHYFLRVPPLMATAEQAVAWTGHFEKQGLLPVLDGRSFAGFAAQS